MRTLLALTLVGSLSIVAVTGQQMTPAGTAGAMTVTKVQGSVYMISGAGPNLTVQVGSYGPVLIDTPPATLVPQVLAEIRKLSSSPFHLLLHTTGSPEYVSGDAALLANSSVREGIIHNELYNRLLTSSSGPLPLPASTITYSDPQLDSYNSEGIVIYQVPKAITDADSIVFFRASDVISTGALYTPGRYPAIDTERGGTIEGVIDGVFKVLELAVPDNLGEGGTLIIPGKGRIAGESDLGEYRNMLVIIAERIKDLRSKGMSMEQIKASRPSMDYDTEYHASREEADRFVETIYRTLPPASAPARTAAPAGGR